MQLIKPKDEAVIDRDFIRHAMTGSTVKLDFPKIEKKINQRPTKQLQRLEAKNRQLQVKNRQLQVKYQRLQEKLAANKKALNDAYLEQRIADNFHNGDKYYATSEN
jgi:predicted RNase H-like nuclease (RuvC/YqgF family)